MAKFPLDLSKFKKIASDKQTTTLLHPDGHEIRIAHAAVEPKMREKLAAIPLHKMAAGGKVQRYADGTDDVEAYDKSQGGGGGATVTGDQMQPGAPGNQTQSPPQYPEPTQHQKYMQDMEKGATSSGLKYLGFAQGGPVKMAEGGGGDSDDSSDTDSSSDDVTPDSLANGKAITINVGQPAQAAAPDPETLAHHIGDSVRQGIADTIGAVKTVGTPIVNAGKQFAQGVMGNQDSAADQAMPSSAPEGSQDNPVSLPETPITAKAPSAPSDPYGVNAYSKAFNQGIEEQRAGIFGESRAQAQQGAQEAQALDKSVQDQQAQLQDYQGWTNHLNNEYSGFIQDYANQKIDPNHYLNSMGTGQKIATGIGLILGGLGSGLTHQGNPALQFLQNNIDRDIDAQKANLGTKQNLLNANMHQFGNLRDATSMTRAMQMGIVSNQLKQAAAKATDPMAKSRALQGAGLLDRQSAAELSQIAMRKTILGGMQKGQVDPALAVRALVSQPEQEAAQKQLQTAQNMGRSRDNLLNAFDQVGAKQTIGNRVLNPFQSESQINALRDPLIAQLSHDSEGRVTEFDIPMIAGLFPTLKDNAQTQALKRNQLNKFISEKMNFPLLDSYQIPYKTTSRYNAQGQNRIPESPVK